MEYSSAVTKNEILPFVTAPSLPSIVLASLYSSSFQIRFIIMPNNKIALLFYGIQSTEELIPWTLPQEHLPPAQILLWHHPWQHLINKPHGRHSVYSPSLQQVISSYLWIKSMGKLIIISVIVEVCKGRTSLLPFSQHAQGHTVRKWWNHTLNQGILPAEILSIVSNCPSMWIFSFCVSMVY